MGESGVQSAWMTDKGSIVARPRDYSDVAKFDLAELQDPTALEEFLDNPATFITEVLAGALAIGKTGAAVAGGRIVQGILKGRAFKQFGAEFKKLRETGKIPDDFAEKKYGFQTWVELMTIIDEEGPDEDRLEALKAMFFPSTERVVLTLSELRPASSGSLRKISSLVNSIS